MNSYKIYNYRNFNTEDIVYADPQKSRGNTYLCGLDKDHDMLFQTGTLSLSSSIIQNDKECYVMVNTEGSDFKDFMVNLDKYNVDYIYKSCKNWFASELPFETVLDFYKTHINGNEIKMNIPLIRKKIEIKVYDEKRTVVPYEHLVENSKVVLVWRLNGLKFLKKECVMDIDIVQIMLMKSKETVVIPVPGDKDSSVSENTGGSGKNAEVLRRMQFREELRAKKEAARLAFEEAEQSQLRANELKQNAARLACELKQMEDEYYREEADEYEESDDEPEES